MKKLSAGILVAVACVFAAFALGFFMGRSMNREPVFIWQPTAPAAEQTVLDINTADASQLQTLPGIGPVLAQRIVDYRTEHGPFRAPEELSKVEGIGQSTILDILDQITAGG